MKSCTMLILPAMITPTGSLMHLYLCDVAQTGLSRSQYASTGRHCATARMTKVIRKATMNAIEIHNFAEYES